MFRRLFDWLFGRRPRDIFQFWDGSRWRSVDPFAVWIAFREATGDDLETLARRVMAPPTPGAVGAMKEAEERQRAEEFQRFHQGIRAAFGVEVFDGQHGLTVKERLDLAVRFLIYLAQLGRQARPTTASPSPTAASPTD